MGTVPYSLPIAIFDFMPTSTVVPGGTISTVRVDAGYAYVRVNPRTEEFQSATASADFPPNMIAGFTYMIPSTPYPSSNPTWDAALVVQEVRGVAAGTGWLFRSGVFPGTLPTTPLEIITPPEELMVTDADIGSAIAGALPGFPASPLILTDSSGNTTTITALTATISGAAIAFTAVGTDSRIPSNITFTFTGILNLIPSGSVHHPDQPFFLNISSPSITFAAPPTGVFVANGLNIISGFITQNVVPSVTATLTTIINGGILRLVATNPVLGQVFNVAGLATLPGDVILSIRAIRGTTRMLPGGGSEPVLGVLGALGAFGGVGARLAAASPPLVTPPPPNPNPRPCFIATAATHADHADVVTLRRWRDTVLSNYLAGRVFIATYDRLSPPLAKAIATRQQLRRLVHAALVQPAARWAAGSLSRQAKGKRPPH
jgi:hypothetical protein